jgi:hypothetical protein
VGNNVSPQATFKKSISPMGRLNVIWLQI